MPDLKTVHSALSDLADGPPLVAVCVAATAGIGEYTVRALAQAFSKQGHKLRVYLVGRNPAPAEKIVAECTKTCPGGQFRFVRANNLGEMEDVDRVCAELATLEKEAAGADGKARVDFLCMGQARSPMEKPSTTKEGFNLQTSLLYYSRMRFILQLMPLLLAAERPAHVVSVFAGGLDSKSAPEKAHIGAPSLGEYGVTSVRRNVAFMKTFFLEQLAERYRGKLSLTHVFPGLVFGPGFMKEDNPVWFRVLWWILTPLLRAFVAVPEVDCGQRTLYLATERYPARGTVEKGGADQKVKVATSTDGVVGGGAYAVNWNGETSSDKPVYEKARKEGVSEKVWKHTMDAFENIDNGKLAFETA